jgi:hypothetical protein
MELSHIFFILSLVFVALTVFSMFGGFSVMMKGGEKNAKSSNKFMQLRIAFQALALGCLALAYISG